MSQKDDCPPKLQHLGPLRGGEELTRQPYECFSKYYCRGPPNQPSRIILSGAAHESGFSPLASRFPLVRGWRRRPW